MATKPLTRPSKLILAAFENYSKDFLEITRRARTRFEQQDWQGRHTDALERLDLYEKSLDAIARQLGDELGDTARDPEHWKKLKRVFTRLIEHRSDRDRAETYYNSVTRKLLWTVGIDRNIEFFHREERPPTTQFELPVVRKYSYDTDTSRLIETILKDVQFSVPYDNLDRDVHLIANEIDLHVWPLTRYHSIDIAEVVVSPFFRNKVAYVVGRILASEHIIPLVLPVYNGPNGLYIDTVLLSEADVSRVFSFAFSYFQVEMPFPDQVIDFLRTILPHKPLAELYISLGLSKQGKTVLYRDLHRYVHVSREKFVIAPGKEGAVMIAFTLPDYEFVLKIIKDHPCFLRTQDVTPKRSTRQEVMKQYDFVCHRDRVGRMVDTQEFENLKFKRKRFTSTLLTEFGAAAREAVSIEREYIVLRHLYIQRKVSPLPMYLLRESDPEAVRRVVIDFGYFLKDLASVGIFPYDLFNMWNYGVTRRGRVVLFDYDDVQPLEKAQFRKKPEPRDESEELEPEEERIAAGGDDFFLDEADRFSGIPRPLKGIFKAVHADLYTLEFWRDMKRRVRRGEQFDITPYDRYRKFRY